MLLESSYLPTIHTTRIHNPFTENLYLARLDQLPYPASGNKWFKLKYNLLEAQRQGLQQLITFGGAYSNHLYATAEAADFCGFKSVGIVRGEEHFPLNKTLCYCASKGMRLFYMSREDYRKKTDETFLQAWMKARGLTQSYLIPEGGSNAWAVKGVSELIDLLPADTNIIATACGTGATLAGLIAGLKPHQEAWGFAVLKGSDFLMENIQQLLTAAKVSVQNKNWKLFSEYHGGGYAKTPDELLSFVREFKDDQGILLDPIYNSKMLYGVFDLASKGLLPGDKKIVLLHTGGVQAWNGLPEKKRIFLSES
jgi:1-aminocyclopropane-1-carboxylate deaminase